MKTCLLFASLFFFNFIFAQDKEFVILRNGDTVAGRTRFSQNKFLLEKAGGIVTTFAPEQISLVYSPEIKNQVVVPCKLRLYKDNLADLELYNNAISDIDTVMILEEVYNTPKMNLYWGTDKFKLQYYFYKTPTDSLPIQLFFSYVLAGGLTASSEKSLTGDNSRVHLEPQKGFVNQLRFIMGDCKKISDGEWEILDYRIYSLKSVIKKFNKCK